LGEDGDMSSDEDDMGWNAEPMAFDEDAVHRNAGSHPDGAEGDQSQSQATILASISGAHLAFDVVAHSVHVGRGTDRSEL
jgi:hypothetical protein